jgi:S1-C subfamily serine protease
MPLLPVRGLALVALTALPLLAGAARPVEGAEPERLDFQAIIETAKRRVYPALVFVKPVQEDLSEGESRRVEVLGSGVIFRPDGYVVTNHHVAEKAKEIRCVLGDRRQVAAKLIGKDKATDLAVLKLDVPADEKLPYAELGTSDGLEEGQFVMALGSPYGFERSISLGIISNARRHLGGSDGLYNNWIQTDAAINPGNSGGPLVNTIGVVIGINTLGIRGANNLGFAIPVDVVRHVIAKLMKDGRYARARHGLTLRALVDYTQDTVFPGDQGVIVDDVAGESPAEAAGIVKGDRILKVGGQLTNGRYLEDLPALRTLLVDLAPGTAVPFLIERGNGQVTLQVTPEADDQGDDAGLECDRWDATFQRISKEETPSLAFYKARGVYVLGVSSPGNAEEAGLETEDIVVKVDGKEVKDLPGMKAIYEAIVAEARPKKRVLFEVLREGLPRLIALHYEKEYDVPSSTPADEGEPK